MAGTLSELGAKLGCLMAQGKLKPDGGCRVEVGFVEANGEVFPFLAPLNSRCHIVPLPPCPGGRQSPWRLPQQVPSQRQHTPPASTDESRRSSYSGAALSGDDIFG